ncbi:unnamed protein product [Heligmosomoides polygyrus]|uniref:Neurotransmitter-gated ion-channel ligand binding domain protein n=1 Tax=Heligmosomoides polygyrus TaxID=6339 RepID=A0A183FMF1_HELPZ|nr:unnamed protein product [Heligmosomoides polygyrus]
MRWGAAVLFTCFLSADGNYEVSFKCNVVINYHGDMLWVPPAIYKSSCFIDVEFFPFDEQVCTLVFGSWTYNENEIKLEFEQAEWVDLSEYAPSSIWDLIDAPASLVNKRSRIEFQVRIRRKTLFYTIVLIIPTVLMAFLTMAVFFLPTDSGEKVTLTTYVLLSIVVFLLLVSKILPPTSSTIPLMAKYLLLTFVLNVITILVTVIIINIYFRCPATYKMPPWVRTLFLEWMPFVMCMQRPRSAFRKLADRQMKGLAQLPGAERFAFNAATHHTFYPSPDATSAYVNASRCTTVISSATFYPLPSDALRAIDAIEYITDHLRNEHDYKMVSNNTLSSERVLSFRYEIFVAFGLGKRQGALWMEDGGLDELTPSGVFCQRLDFVIS